MNLHHDKEVFEELVVAASNELAISANVIEKDYYVTLILKAISEQMKDIVFKGGTSLTKCYQLLERFSEDIDLSYSAESGRPGDARKKKLKNTIVNIMEEYGFTITNLDMTRSRRNYNCYRADYPSMYNKNNILKPELVVETYIALLPFPTTKRSVDNYIYRFLVKINRMDLILKYDLMPFEILTQTIERILVDKVFALCDYYMQGEVTGHSRHLYDIYKIVDAIGVNKEVKRIIPEVRKVRSELSICPSAQENVSVTEILNEIIERQVYKKDYNDVTLGLLFVPETYDTVITGIQKIIDSSVWNNSITL